MSVGWTARRMVGGLVLFLAYARWYNKHWFPRDPERTVNRAAPVVAPADGRVIYIEEVREGTIPISVKGRRELPLHEVVKGDARPPAGVIVGIFLSPYDVHYQRSPIEGTVVETSYHPAPKNHLMTSMFVRNLFRIQPMYAESAHVYANERNVIHLRRAGSSAADGPARRSRSVDEAYVVQIADQVVNKIDCYVTEGETVAKGAKIGMIRQGSQVDLYLPGLTLDQVDGIRVGEKVIGGETAIVG